MPVQLPGLKASGTVSPSRFVKYSGSNTVAHAGVGEVPFGVSQRGTGTTPLPSAATSAAVSGQVLQVFGNGEICQIEAGEALAIGDYVTPGADGVAMKAIGGTAYYGQALHVCAAAGEMVDVLLMRGTLPTPSTSIASAGSTAANSTALTANTRHSVSGADGTKGVTLPAAVAGMYVDVYNEHATNGLKIWPATGDDVNDGTTDAAITIEGKTLARLYALDGTTWAAQFTVNT